MCRHRIPDTNAAGSGDEEAGPSTSDTAASAAEMNSGIPGWVYLIIALVVIAAVVLLVMIERRSRATHL